MWAVCTVTAALALYSIGTFKAQRARRSTRGARGFLSAGLTLDVNATALMIAATGATAPTLPGRPRAPARLPPPPPCAFAPRTRRAGARAPAGGRGAPPPPPPPPHKTRERRVA